MLEFGTAGIRGRVSDTLPPESVVEVGRAIAADGQRVVVGRDGRTTGAGLMDAVVAGLTSGGAEVDRLGVLPTPALAFASTERMGVMVTASHNPPADNGIKVFRDGTEISREMEARIEGRIADESRPVSWDQWGHQRVVDVLEPYRKAVLAYLGDFGGDPAGLSVAIDCGSGVGGLAAPEVLTRLGADVRTLNARIDGHFPARPSKPTAETLSVSSGFVADGPYDLGLALDGDADRLVVMAEDGTIVHEDTVLAIMAAAYVERSEYGDPIVLTTPNASTRIDDRVSSLGGRVERTSLGSLHEGIERFDESSSSRVVFAAEPWKHVHPAFGGWIDAIAGAGVFVKFVAEAGSLDALRAPIEEHPYRKRSVPCPANAQAATMAALEAQLPDRFADATVDTRYGVRLTFPEGGWLLVRPSGTEPVIRLYVEHPDVDEVVDRAIDTIEELVEAV